jgi:hypothetical protein
MTYRHACSTLLIVFYLAIACYASETTDTAYYELICIERCNKVGYTNLSEGVDQSNRSYCNLGCVLGSDLDMVYTDALPTTTPP